MLEATMENMMLSDKLPIPLSAKARVCADIAGDPVHWLAEPGMIPLDIVTSYLKRLVKAEVTLQLKCSNKTKAWYTTQWTDQSYLKRGVLDALIAIELK